MEDRKQTEEQKVYALDYETFFESEYGIDEKGVYGYLHDPRFDAYLIAVWGEDIQWVGHPKDFPHWDKIGGGTFIAHHSGFDRQVFERCIELGVTPASARPKTWFCSANMSASLGGPRSLKDAAKTFLGVELSKEMRNYMKGRTWADAVAEGKDGLLKDYALDDAKYCYQLWVKLNHRWTESERRAAEMTYQQTVKGVQVDMELLNDALPKVVNAREDALAKIPWAGTTDEKGEELKPLSAKALKAWCKDNGIPIPITTEAKSPEFQKWQEENKDVTVVKAMQLYRSANALALKAETVRRQIRPDGRYGFNMLYFGATTGRWSSSYADDRNDSGGVNLQNLPKEELYGLNLRKVFVAAPGKKFIISDLAQIEPRCLAWLAGDDKFLNTIRSGIPIYEAHAMASMGWKQGPVPLKKANAVIYALAKARLISLGYGASWSKFRYMAKAYGAGECLLAPVTAAQIERFKGYAARTRQQDKLVELVTQQDWTEAVNSWVAVTDYRNANPKIAGRSGLWKRLEADCRRCLGADYTVELPSGRKLTYFNVNSIGGLTAQKQLHEAPIKIYHGILAENITQGFARDVLLDAMIRLEDAGMPALWSVHDELVHEVDEDFPSDKIREIMVTPPTWAPDLPLEIEQTESKHYKK